MKVSENVRNFFVKDAEGYYVLNSQLQLDFTDMQQGVKFLVDIIRFWHGKRKFFCHDNTFRWESNRSIDLPSKQWSFSYKWPSDCYGCVSGQKNLDKIFGSLHVFNKLPFVTYRGDREYSFRFDLMEYYAEHGSEATVRLIEKRKQDVARKNAEKEEIERRTLQEEQKSQLFKRFEGAEISDDLFVQIMPYANEPTLKVVNKHIAVMKDSRSEWGSSGGIGYYDQIRVFCGRQCDLKEWQWRDRYDAARDRHSLCIHGIGDVTVSEEGGKIAVAVELINTKYGNRTTTFTFDHIEPVKIATLSTEDQAAFAIKVETELQRIMGHLEKLWMRKPKMRSSTGDVSYRHPSIKQKEIRAELGVAAFVTEEQIDHMVSDPQMRYELFVLGADAETAHCVAEDHGYDRQDGGAFLTILDLNVERVTINTKNGKSTIPLKE